MVDQAAGAPDAATASARGLSWRPLPPRSAALTARLAVPATLVGCLLLAAASVRLQGFRFGVDNNLFHIPIVLRWYDLPQFANDAFIQSLRRYATPVYPLLSYLATEQTIRPLFFGAHLLARTLTFYALFQAARAMGLRALWAAAALATLCLAAPLYRLSAIGHDDVLIDLFTHTELAQAVALMSAAWLIRGEPIKAAAAAGVAFDLNLMVGAWMLAPLAVRLAADLATRRRGLAGVLTPAGVFALIAAPEIAWLAASQSLKPPAFDYAAYLADYYPYHFFIGWAPWRDRIALAFEALSALAALWFVPRNRLGAAALLLGLAALFGAGALIDQHTRSRLILNLHLLRVDGLILWSAALIVATGACAALASSRAALLPGALVALGALTAGRWPLALAGLLVAIAADLASRRRDAPAWLDRRVSGGLAPLALVAVGAVALLHGGYSSLPRPPAPLEPPSDGQLLGAAPASGEWLAVTGWARTHTQPGALFLVPWKLEFEAAAMRRSWVGWKEGASAMWAPETYAAWRRRGDEIRALPDAHAQLAYACAHRIDYVVMDLRPGHALPGASLAAPASFRDRWFSVVAPRCAAHADTNP